MRFLFPILKPKAWHGGRLQPRLIDYLWFYVPLKNFSLIWRRHHCRWRAAKFRPMLGAQGLWEGRGSLSCHTCCDTGPRFFQFHPKDRPIQSLLTTHEGMWRIYSNPDPHGSCSQEKCSQEKYKKIDSFFHPKPTDMYGITIYFYKLINWHLW